MELKPIPLVKAEHVCILLIVPYGIETDLNFIMMVINCLLIVPYGIETFFTFGIKSFLYLLIVPYGIETEKQRRENFSHLKLLIVPYGIETLIQRTIVRLLLASFNRTLWN